MLLFDNLGGVPVFNLPNLISNSAMFSDRFTDAGSPARPALKDEDPMCINPLRKVPTVNTTISL